MVMPCFASGNPVYILPKFAHLYPANKGVVIAVTPDAFRPMFNEYTVEFADRSNARLMEFQIIEDVPNYTTEIARLTLHSQHQSSAVHVRGGTSSCQMILQAAGYDIDMAIRVTKTHTTIMGQVLQRGTTNLLKDLDVRL